MDNPAVIRIGANDSIEVGFTPAKSHREASVIKIRRINRITDPTWMMFGLDECRDIVAGLRQAVDDRRFERDVRWYGQDHILHMRRFVPALSPGFVALDVLWENSATGKQEKVTRPGTSIEIPADQAANVASALQTAYDRCHPRRLGFLS